MTLDINFDPSRTALLSMDVQAGRLNRYEIKHPGLTNRLSSVIKTGRAAGLLIVHVVLQFREGYPEIHETSGGFAQVKAQGLWQETDPASQVSQSVGPEVGDLVVVKHRTGAFSGTDLDLILRSRGIGTLVLAGLTTGGVVLSTLRHAADHDYRINVLSDCCVDDDDEAHRVLMEKVFTRHAQIITAEEFSAYL